MSRYIDADAFMKEVVKIQDLRRLSTKTIGEALDRTPTADVVEVKHGRWIKDRLCTTNGGTYGVRRCSVCEDYYQDVGYGWNYCPNCGAKMDEREE